MDQDARLNREEVGWVFSDLSSRRLGVPLYFVVSTLKIHLLTCLRVDMVRAVWGMNMSRNGIDGWLWGIWYRMYCTEKEMFYTRSTVMMMIVNAKAKEASRLEDEGSEGKG